MTKELEEIAAAVRANLLAKPLVQIRPTTLREKLRYTDDPALRAQCAAAEKLIEAAAGGRETMLDRVLEDVRDLILFGNVYHEW